MQKKKKQDVSLSTTTMVDVLFILLIFFVLVTTIKKDAIEVTAPKVKATPEKKPPQESQKTIVISLDQKDCVFLNSEPVQSEEQLRKMLAQIKKNTPEGTKVQVVFRTDVKSTNGKTTEVLAALSAYQLIGNLQWEIGK